MVISVVLPAYQEAENLVSILPELHKVLRTLDVPYEILVIDTIEPLDNTSSVCKEYCATYIPREGGNLYGDAIRTGFTNAEGNYIVIMDADGSHDSADIIRFYNEMEKGHYNLIIGSRYCKGGSTENNFVLRFMSWGLNLTYRVIFGLKIKDISNSFRMYKKTDIKSLFLECNNFDIVEEILLQLNYTIPNFRAKEVPILFRKRAAGESKRDLVAFIMSYLKTIQRLYRIKRRVLRK